MAHSVFFNLLSHFLFEFLPLVVRVREERSQKGVGVQLWVRDEDFDKPVDPFSSGIDQSVVGGTYEDHHVPLRHRRNQRAWIHDLKAALQQSHVGIASQHLNVLIRLLFGPRQELEVPCPFEGGAALPLDTVQLYLHVW